MKILLSTICFAFLTLSYPAYSLIDPDSLDPSMPVVSYLISSDNIKIKSYRQGVPSHLTITLCNNCIEKTYSIATTATLKYLRKPIDKSDLALRLLQKKYPLVRLGINRSTQEITNLQIGASVYDELPLQKNKPVLPLSGVKKL